MSSNSTNDSKSSRQKKPNQKAFGQAADLFQPQPEDPRPLSVIKEIARFSTSSINKILRDTIHELEKLSREDMDSLGPFDQVQPILENLRIILSNREAIIDNTTDILNYVLLGQKALNKAQKSTASLSLSLVDNTDLDEMIVVSTIEGKLKNNYEQHIRTIRRGIVRLGKLIELNPEPDALTISELLQAFKEALEGFEIEFITRRKLYEQFLIVAGMAYEDYYTGILTILQEAGVVSTSENPTSPNFEMVYEFRRQDDADLAEAQPTAVSTPKAPQRAPSVPVQRTSAPGMAGQIPPQTGVSSAMPGQLSPQPPLGQALPEGLPGQTTFGQAIPNPALSGQPVPAMPGSNPGYQQPGWPVAGAGSPTTAGYPSDAQDIAGSGGQADGIQVYDQQGNAVNTQQGWWQGGWDQIPNLNQEALQSTRQAIRQDFAQHTSAMSGSYIAPVLGAPIAAANINQETFKTNTVSQLLYSFLNGAPVGQQAQRNNPALPALESQALLGLVNRYQQQNTALQDRFNENYADNAKRISNEITEQLTSAAAEEEKSLAETELNAIELVNQLFVSIINDPELSDPVKAQISRLQIPYIKVALLDITFLKEEAHPARLLLNELAALGVGVSDRASPVLAEIQTVVELTIRNFQHDLNIFIKLLERIRTFRDQFSENSSQASLKTLSEAETQAGNQYLKHRVIVALRNFLRGKTLPKELYKLVLKGFAPLLLAVHKRHGPDSRHWFKSTDTFRQIVESVQPHEDPGEVAIIAKRSDDLLERARKLLSPVTKRMQNDNLLDSLKAIYDRIKQQHQDNIQQGQQTVDASQVPDPFDYTLNEPSVTDTSELDSMMDPVDIMQRLPAEVKTGIWVDLYQGNEGNRRLKLSAILEDSAQLVFIDETGSDSVIKPVLEFVDELDVERSRIIQENNLFDKALSTVLTNIQAMKIASSAAA